MKLDIVLLCPLRAWGISTRILCVGCKRTFLINRLWAVTLMRLACGRSSATAR